MRVTMLGAAVLALAGCGPSEEERDANAAAANYRPPTVTARADFGGAIERRFHRLDTNGDDKLTADELPPRLRGALPGADRDGDRKLTSEEWGSMMLARFDARDLNRDGSVTSEERRQWREKHAGQ